MNQGPTIVWQHNGVRAVVDTAKMTAKLERKNGQDAMGVPVWLSIGESEWSTYVADVLIHMCKKARVL